MRLISEGVMSARKLYNLEKAEGVGNGPSSSRLKSDEQNQD